MLPEPAGTSFRAGRHKRPSVWGAMEGVRPGVPCDGKMRHELSVRCAYWM